MAKKQPEFEEDALPEETPRPLSEEERVSTETEGEEGDVFEGLLRKRRVKLKEGEKKGRDRETAEKEGEETPEKDAEADKEMPVDREEGITEEGTIDRSVIKAEILEKAQAAKKREAVKKVTGIPLTFLEDPRKGNAFIGRKKNVFRKYGYDATFLLGKVNEPGNEEKRVYLDSMNPHVVFVCGARGSGKSYVLGVVAEGLAAHNPNVGVVVIDPVGVFWSMRYPNREEKELDRLTEWSLMPQGLDNVRVFIPEGVKEEAPKLTYDDTFAIQPSLLTAEDWCLTFGIERFSPTGLLMEKALKKVEKGYATKEGATIPGKKKDYDINDIIECLEQDGELNSRERGYKQDSVRALVSRYEAARNWGIFSREGTPLSELSRCGQMTVVDTSFLDDNVTALIIGVLARRVLAARKLVTRKEAATRFKDREEALAENDIPPTWMFIDEAHTLIPSGNVKTPATEALVEYVKQGRRPGCSLVFATQQPSAIDSKVLSQLDIMLTHKLVFDDDIKAVFRRTPTIVPQRFKKSGMIKTMPVGVALTADRSEETSRAFVMKIRPRMSQHEGRDADTAEQNMGMPEHKVKKLMAEILLRKVHREETLSLEALDALVEKLNTQYNTSIEPDSILDQLEKAGIEIGEEEIRYIPEEEEEAGDAAEKEEAVDAEEEEMDSVIPEELEEEAQAEETELLSFPVRFDREQIQKVALRHREKKWFGLLGTQEDLKSLTLKYQTVWKARYDIFSSPNEFTTRECYVDSITGEFLHFTGKEFRQSTGLGEITNRNRDEAMVLRLLVQKPATSKELAKQLEVSGNKIQKMLDEMEEDGLVLQKGEVYHSTRKVDLPPDAENTFLYSVSKIPTEKIEAVAKERENIGREQVQETLEKMWEGIRIRDISEVHRPVYEAVLAREGQERRIRIDAFTGKVLH